MSQDFIEELRWRGILHDMMPGTDEFLKDGHQVGYIGFDPTADSMHIGHLTQVFTLLRFQKAGHRPIALIGGATGMVGDPSGKSAERNLLDEKTLEANVAGLKKQLEKLLDFSDPENGAILVNNYDWLKGYSFLNFIRDVGKHLTVSYMMAKDSVKSRLETGMSFTEFSYQLIQAFDFFVLFQKYGCRLQMGGSDQWGNITSGTELIRRKAGGEAFAVTTQLIKKTDGTKFGKTESGAVWLDRNKTSPYRFYQFWINTSDDDARNWIKVFTFFTREETEELISEHEKDPGLRLLQKTLARELTRQVHSGEDLKNAEDASAVLFSGGLPELLSLDDNTFTEVFEGVPQFEIARAEIEKGTPVLDLLADKTQVFSSKGEARKMILGGGVSINKKKIDSIESLINSEHVIRGRFIIIQKGKKNYYLCNVN